MPLTMLEYEEYVVMAIVGFTISSRWSIKSENSTSSWIGLHSGSNSRRASINSFSTFFLWPFTGRLVGIHFVFLFPDISE